MEDCRRTRRKAFRNKGVFGRNVLEIPVGKWRPIKAIPSTKLSNELGILARKFLSLPNKWKDLTKEEKDATLIR
ncbi:hypothetical protein A4A49_28940 [Nicotiana attenuata]|uniref:Uncharacterized protein n=1 Tax=Nicotiana attenuata TaxID=49451 RepID=A0A1J6IVK9_NICAT|nr:hypothetical protein A4A49_28940 [Nicotiana attenuata]